MENYAYFYNSDNGDRVYDADSMTDWLLPFFTTGVFNGQLQVTANENMTITVSGGYCNIAGKVKHFVSATTFDLETASGTLNRIDNVILRRDDTQRDIYLMIEKGGNAQNPTAPELTRNGTIHDLKLAEIYINAGTIAITQANITDTRMDADVCGWVAATVKEIDFSQITTQFNDFFAIYKNSIAGEYAAFLEEIGATEQQAQEAYDKMAASFQNYAEAQQALFDEWFQSMKDQLSEDAAGALQLEIDTLNKKIADLEAKFTQAATAYIGGNIGDYVAG